MRDIIQSGQCLEFGCEIRKIKIIKLFWETYCEESVLKLSLHGMNGEEAICRNCNRLDENARRYIDSEPRRNIRTVNANLSLYD